MLLANRYQTRKSVKYMYHCNGTIQRAMSHLQLANAQVEHRPANAMVKSKVTEVKQYRAGVLVYVSSHLLDGTR